MYEPNLMDFEELYPPELQMSRTEKEELVHLSDLVTYLRDPNKVAYAESIAIRSRKLVNEFDDSLPDLIPSHDILYVYSTTVIESHQGKGAGRKLIRQQRRESLLLPGVSCITGHATTPAMLHLRLQQGAIVTNVHNNWEGSTRTAHFYTLMLPQSKASNCGPTALAYMLLMQGYNFSVDTLEDHLETTDKDGTSPKVIHSYLLSIFPSVVLAKELDGDTPLPLLVNYFEGEDGHYAVITEIGSTTIRFWDPSDAQFHTQGIATFLENWYSPRYGKTPGIHLTRKEPTP